MIAQLKKIAIFSLLLLSTSIKLFAQDSGKADWFKDARFGMFIHWGLYSAAEGIWKGEPLRYMNNYAEWLRYRNRVSKEEYGSLAKRFDWDKIDPEQWVLLAKEAGMKYIIITTKHHDGVALWDTKVGTYSLPKLSGANRDVIKEIAAACKKHGIKLGFYYSHWIDWEHPYGWNHQQELSGHVTDAQYNQYWQEKVVPQLRELMSNYGDISLIWFDMWIPYQKSIIKKEQLLQVVKLIRELQPNCLINSRLGLPTDAENVDFETLGDNQFGSNFIAHPWETPGTIAHSWGYNGQENEWKSTSQIFQSLISNVSLNGGFTLNIGPRADGTVPYESVSRLHNVGSWLNSYGQSIYGGTGLSLKNNHFDWGYLTTKIEQNKTVVYAHVFNWPLDHKLRITGIKSKPSSIALLKGSSLTSLNYEQKLSSIHIELPGDQPDHYVSEVKLTFDGSLELDRNTVPESTFGGFSLKSTNSLNSNLKIVPYNGKNPTHAVLAGNTTINWEVTIPEVGTYALDLSAHNPNKEHIPFEIDLASQQLKGSFAPGKKMVVEPNENNYTEEFVEKRIGTFKFDKPGKYILTYKSRQQLPFWFNWLWLEKTKH
ncbi:MULTISPECIES: alpha-L-fucosidase [unclassified Sphingobacterium]|uniref:alpha-L-fucosidase n=1 Tax=unclassified Sphingobacterium TaxID=2609468 RepID=UPI0025E0A2D9|nr:MULTISPECIES: alpha-L-fucosidase [unclassified Sphingobacterium]